EHGGAPFADRSIPQGAATSVRAAAVAANNEIGGRYCEDCYVAEIVDGEGFSGGVRPYALDREHTKALWTKSEELVDERL
ncbi:MAG TPA: shikimate dehydrogenase, partial [Sphingomonas sp.]|nr:shikimate dehydrogenase [Sphingomonas sp.]